MIFFSASGSLFELERLIECNNYIIKDSALKRFISLAEMCYYQYKGIYNDEFMRLTREFIDGLIDFKLSSTELNLNMSLRVHRHLAGIRSQEISELQFGVNDANAINLERPFVIGEKGKVYNFYFLKKMSVEEFRERAKIYLDKFLLTIDSKDFLVLDHFLSSIESNYDVKSKYFNNLRCILVWRDPRDVYTQIANKNMEWAIPTKNVDEFIKWYRISVINQLEGEGVNFENCLVIRFEDFVLKYDEISKKVMDFIGLKEADHIDPKGYFKPEISGKTIGIYKNCEYQEAIKKIEKELAKFIYNS